MWKDQEEGERKGWRRLKKAAKKEGNEERELRRTKRIGR